MTSDAIGKKEITASAVQVRVCVELLPGVCLCPPGRYRCLVGVAEPAVFGESLVDCSGRQLRRCRTGSTHSWHAPFPHGSRVFRICSGGTCTSLRSDLAACLWFVGYCRHGGHSVRSSDSIGGRQAASQVSRILRLSARRDPPPGAVEILAPSKLFRRSAM